VPIVLDARVKAEGGYHVQVSVPDTSQALTVLGSSVTLWGVPADPAHDPQRTCEGSSSNRPPQTGCRAEAPREAFLANPTSCAASGEGLATRLSIDSWTHPGTFATTSFVSHDPPGYVLRPENTPTFAAVFDPRIYELPMDKWGRPQGPTGCDELAFDPSIDVRPSSTAPDSPTGLNVDLQFPQAGLSNPVGQASAQLKRAKVTLPEGMTVSPSSADGLAGCSDAQIGIGNDNPIACPDASKIGTVTAKTPLLDETLQGSVFVGTQLSDDPASGRMFRIFLVIDNKPRGILLKLAGQVRVRPDGQIETIFDNNPQAPVSEISLNLKTGARAPLATPPSCGDHTVTAELSSWGGQTTNLTDTFHIDCPPDLGRFSPSFAAGALSPIAGAFSPLLVRINRPDRQQYLAGVTAQFAGGMLAKLRHVPLCDDTDADQGTCPVQTRIGTATIGVGPGPAPFYLKAPVALTGPYKGAPYGLSVAVRAVAGPFDLGTVVVRQAIYVDPSDAHITVISDPLPVVVKGVPVRLRSVNVDIDRPGFALNPTGCAQKHLQATFTSTQNTTSRQTADFEATNCAALPFAPKLALKLTGKGQTTDGKHPGFKATLTQPPHQAAIKNVKVVLPLSLALDPENAVSDTLCEFDEGQKPNPHCPKSSIIGKATAISPLLNHPLTGNVYFVKNVRTDKKTGRKIRTLPTLLIALRGDIAINLRSQTAVSKGRLVSSFSTVPDAPVTRFDLTLNGGPKGILTTIGNTCKRSRTATLAITAHNDKTKTPNTTTITAPCNKHR
jgi:hypothetical protein